MSKQWYEQTWLETLKELLPSMTSDAEETIVRNLCPGELFADAPVYSGSEAIICKRCDKCWNDGSDKCRCCDDE